MSTQTLVSRTTQTIKIDPSSQQVTVHISVDYVKINQ
jgi:hypothetical protein